MAVNNFQWRVESTEEEKRIFVSGTIDESVSLDSLTQEIKSPACFDLYGVDRLNSTGITHWCRFMEAISPFGPHRFRRCSPSFVSQINMIPNVVGDGKVESIMAPFSCDRCGVEISIEFPTIDPKALLPIVNCQQCKSVMVFDELEDNYLAFLRAQE